MHALEKVGECLAYGRGVVRSERSGFQYQKRAEAEGSFYGTRIQIWSMLYAQTAIAMDLSRRSHAL